MIRIPPPLAVLSVAGHLLVPMAGHAQQVPEWLLRLKLPNSAAKSIMTPHRMGRGLRIRIHRCRRRRP